MKLRRLSLASFSVTFLFSAILFCFSIPQDLFAADKIRIVTTTSTLASITREIADARAEIHSVAPPKQDIHFVAPTPKDVLKVKKADVFIHGGLDLEVWRDPLLHAAGNRAFLGEAKRAIDVSRGIQLLEVPVSISRAQGDIHLYGNPHYWLDPVNARTIADHIAKGLANLYPDQADFFLKNAERFKRRLDEKIHGWQKRLAPYRGMPVVVYHNSWPYFFERFGLVRAELLEPKPGIPPTAKHISELLTLMRVKKIKVIVKESFHENRTPAKVAKETGARVLSLFSEAGQAPEGTYFSLMEHNVRLLEEAFAPAR